MLRQRNEQIQALVRFFDILICVFSFFAAYWFRFSRSDFASLGSLSWILAVSLALHIFAYPHFGFYGSLRLKRIVDILMMVLKSVLLEAAVLGSLVFVLQAKETSRLFFGVYLLINYGLVLLEKLGARVMLASLRRRGYNYRRVLVCGMGTNADAVVQALRRNNHWGYLPYAFLRAGHEDASVGEKLGMPVLGQISDLERVLREHAVDEVYFALDGFDAREIQDEVALCEMLGIPARISLSFKNLPHSKVAFSLLEDVPVITFYTTLMTPAQAFLKRVMDIAVSLVGLLITAVLYPWIAYRIRRDSPGPIFFKQVRVGENGRRFKCYKFRTMNPDAESKKTALLESNEMEGPMFKMENDPRIFAFGSFLRRTSLDELPQFLNILRGEMSVVGTRPPTPDEVLKYEPHFRRRLSIRPGLTGLWQVSGRSRVRKFDEVVALDLRYIDQWSIWLDITIIFKTLWITLLRRGAS